MVSLSRFEYFRSRFGRRSAAQLAAYDWSGDPEAIESMGQGRPPFDCHTHEHDLRHAIGRPGGREHPVVDALAAEASGALEHVPATLTIDFTDGGTHAAGGGGPEATVSLSRFEYFRSRFGRRSAAQLAAYDWSGDPGAIAAAQDGWWFFGIADEDIVE